MSKPRSATDGRARPGGAHVALLRGVNVGGKNPLPMAELAGLFTALGCREVRTYIQSGNVAVPTATVRIADGAERHEEAATGDGPVDAIFNAIDRALGVQTKLLEYVVQAVTPGKQAIGEVSVSLEIDGRKFVGRGASTDILEASAKAYVNALNKLEYWKKGKEKSV